MPGRLFYRLAHLVVAVEVEHVRNEVERILVVLDLGVEAREVEAVRQVLLVDFAKVLVAAGRDELKRAVVLGALLQCWLKQSLGIDGWMAGKNTAYPIPPVAGVVAIGLGPVVIHACEVGTVI